MSQKRPVSESLTRFIVVVSLFAIVFGRALSVALPGSRAGLGRLLEVNYRLGSFASQLLAVLLILAIGRLAVQLWQDARLSFAYRLTVAPAAMLVMLLLATACCDDLRTPYTPEIALIMGIAGTLVAINAIGPSLHQAHSRAAGLVLGILTLASVAQMGARLLALQASGAALPKQFAVARWLATAASSLDVLALLLVVLWLLSHWQRGRVTVVMVAAAAVALAIVSQRGARPGAGFAAVLVSRSLAQLHREPASLLPIGVQNVQEILAFLLALVLLRQPRAMRLQLRASLALVLLARSSPDIPLCAGLLVAGALGLLARALDIEHSSSTAAPSSAVLESWGAAVDESEQPLTEQHHRQARDGNA